LENDEMSKSSTEQKSPATHRRHRRGRRTLLSISGFLLVGTMAAACGSNTAGSTATTAVSPGAGGGSATAVDTATKAGLGTILVNSKGFTLYRLNKDSAGKSTCTTSCAQVWPPLLVTGSGSPVAGSGVTGLGTIPVAGGQQVTYHGMPLYTFTGDSSAGQTNGQGVTDAWGTWFVVTTAAPAGGTTTTTAPSGGGPAF
jgi:predicted lipoprotein with Yx(FWY)xxD motif